MLEIAGEGADRARIGELLTSGYLPDALTLQGMVAQGVADDRRLAEELARLITGSTS